MAVSEDTDHVNWKETYRGLKKKLKILLQENECYQAELRRSQGQLLQATRDRTFLLERLMQYQNVESSGSDSEETDESEAEAKPEPPKSRKRNPEPSNGPVAVAGKKKRSASSSSSRGTTQPANTRNVTRSTAVEKQGGKSTTITRSSNQRPSIEMSDSSSGFAEGFMNAR